VYDAAGETLDETVELRMRDWVQRNPKGSHGEHRYTPADFGIDAAQVTASFAGYSDRFGALLQWR
ncbi:MAG: sulfotransferase family protein, partial [Candidatus Dormibacteria bacterium]